MLASCSLLFRTRTWQASDPHLALLVPSLLLSLSVPYSLRISVIISCYFFGTLLFRFRCREVAANRSILLCVTL